MIGIQCVPWRGVSGEIGWREGAGDGEGEGEGEGEGGRCRLFLDRCNLFIEYPVYPAAVTIVSGSMCTIR